MRALLGFPVISTMLVAGWAVAGAQQGENLATPQQKQQQQQKAQETEAGRAGTTEPSAEHPTSEPQATAAFVNGRLAVPGAPADGQTVPAKYSERNAALDALPTMAAPLRLNDKQRQAIREAVGKSPVANVTAQPADLLPPSVEMREMPSALGNEVPALRNLGFVRTEHGILLARSLDRIVVQQIPDDKPAN